MEKRGGTPISRVGRVKFHTPATTPKKRLERHVLGTYSSAFVEETTGAPCSGGSGDCSSSRYEVSFEFDGDVVGDLGNGRLKKITAKDDWQPVSTNLGASPPTFSENAASDVSDLVSSLSYQSNGNLASAIFSGGDADLDGSRPQYTILYTWQQAMAATMQVQGLNYLSRQIAVDSGKVEQDCDPNGLCSSYLFDPLGRLTTIDPPGSVEQTSRIVYPSLKITRLIQQASTSVTNFEPNNAEQIFGEVRYDGLGRVKERIRALPDGKLGVQIVKYDDLGRAVFTSETMSATDSDGDGTYTLDTTCGDGTRGQIDWPGVRDIGGDGTADYSIYEVPTCTRTPCPGCAPVTLPWGSTTFYGVPDAGDPTNPLKATPDPLGRVREVRGADGAVTKTEYCGPHQQVTVENVHTTSGDVSSSTRYYHDGLGRLAVVDAPAEGTDAEYRYDARGNLIKATMVGQVTGDPFQKWRDGSIVPQVANQVRTFTYDAVGRQRTVTTPEKGTDRSLAYDALGNLLLGQDQLGFDRCFFFHTVQDVAGRPIRTERRLGTKVGSTCTSTTPSSDRELLSGAGRLESTSGWTEGRITSNSFDTAPGSYWEQRSYPFCGITPPIGDDTGSGLYLGDSGCSYASAGDLQHAVRMQVNGVTRDDLFSFQYWRQVRESATLGSGNLDEFSVFVTLNDPTSLTNRRVLFQQASGQASHSRWMRAPSIRPADLFTQTEWPEGQTKTIYLFFVFDKNDTATSQLGTGIAIDNVTVGRKAIETLSEQIWDVSQCGVNGFGGDACIPTEESSDLVLGKPTGSIAYQDGWIVARQYLTYYGLNGRLSGAISYLDWSGGLPTIQGSYESFVTRKRYSARGVAYELIAPYQPGKDLPRTYRASLKRDALTGLQDVEAAQYFFGNASGTAGILYDAAAMPIDITFANGTKQEITRDHMHRIKRITSQAGATPTTFWSTGSYLFDGAGNIKAIGVEGETSGSYTVLPQEFFYDKVGRLTRAITTAQVNQTAGSSTTTDYSFDPFGNMLSHLRTAGASVPSWYDWSGRTYDGNRITSHGYVHDATGNTLRMIDSGGVTSGALWDDRGRMRVLVGGDPYTAAGIPSENYLFDASGNRFMRQDKRGFPTITLRDLSGQALAEYTKKSGDTFPKLDRDLIYGAGKLLVERVVTGVLPHAMGSDPVRTSSNYNFSLDAGTTSSSYDVDIQTSAGFQNYLTGISLGSGNSFTIPESALQSQQVNFVRIRGANPQITKYSQPVSVIYDPNITSSSTNNVRALAISRSGTSVLVRWELAGTTTKKFRVYFKNADGSATYLLTPLGLSSGSRTYTLTDQTLSQVCGDFYVTIVLTEVPLTESPPSPFGRLGSSQSGIQGPLDPCGGGTGSNPISYSFANSYHHRDHLGSLRAETDEAGNRTVKRDYYAFGIEQQGYAASAEAATARQFTSAEKGFFNGLDYMMARFNSGNAGRFLSPDPVLGNALNPQSWNRYSFVLNSPLNYIDPSGKISRKPEQEAGSPAYNTTTGNFQIQANNGGPTAFQLQTAAALQAYASGWQGPGASGSPQEAAMQQLAGSTGSGLTTADTGEAADVDKSGGREIHEKDPVDTASGGDKNRPNPRPTLGDPKTNLACPPSHPYGGVRAPALDEMEIYTGTGDGLFIRLTHSNWIFSVAWRITVNSPPSVPRERVFWTSPQWAQRILGARDEFTFKRSVGPGPWRLYVGPLDPGFQQEIASPGNPDAGVNLSGGASVFYCWSD